MRAAVAVLLCVIAGVLTGCGGGSSNSNPNPPAPQPTISLQLSSTSVQISHDGTAADISVAVTATGATAPATLTTSGVPSGVSVAVQQPNGASPGKLTFAVTNPSQARAATYPVSVQAGSGGATGSANLTLTIGAVAAVTTAVSGHAAFMSTSFQVADWSYAWLGNHPNAAAPLADLAPQHIRLQLLDGAIPQTGPDQWNFSKLDALVQPVLAVGDQSPQLQIGAAPAFMYDSTGKLRDKTYQEFATYCANLVRYYNKGGFTAGGSTYRSPSNTPIVWWGIYNEPNINNVAPDEYIGIYNAAAAAMLAVDPQVKVTAIELSDWGNEPQRFLPPLIAGATAPIHAVATHYYGTCNQRDTDQMVMSAVAGFADHVRYFRSTLDANSSTAGVPIWVTENNVNADYSNNGRSTCHPDQAFVTDRRGSSAFFAGWRPYVYSQLARAGATGLWHWSFTGDAQYGELDDNGNKLLSYWVDYHLSHLLGLPADILATTASEADRIEVFAAARSDGARVITVANHDVAAGTDNNGTGVAKTVALDLSALGPFSSLSLIAIDSTTNAATGPVTQTLTPAQKMTLTFPGYGVQFLVAR